VFDLGHLVAAEARGEAAIMHVEDLAGRAEGVDGLPKEEALGLAADVHAVDHVGEQHGAVGDSVVGGSALR